LTSAGRGCAEVRVDPLDVGVAVELVDDDRRLAELAGPVARLRAGVVEGGLLGQRRRVALVADDPPVA
jgi:hypothetical protein